MFACLFAALQLGLATRKDMALGLVQLGYRQVLSSIKVICGDVVCMDREMFQ